MFQSFIDLGVVSLILGPIIDNLLNSSIMSCLSEGAEFISEAGKTYLAVSSLGQSNVWTAVEKDDMSNIVVLKAPSDNDIPGQWPRFQHEMIMHELFKNSKNIRRQVDRIPPTPEGSPPILVLEITETTLWGARTKRPFSRGEIVATMKGILLSLQEVHEHGLVYGDLKMENVMLSGFNSQHAGDGSNLTVKLGDLGTVMSPANGTMQPIAYRAPEVYFHEEITPAADIWAVGLVYSHLLEAQENFSKAGLYDNLTTNSSRMDERVSAVRNEISQDYDLQNNSYYKHCWLPERDLGHEKGNHWSLMRERGLQERDVDFLKRVMIANPKERPSAKAILASYWFKGGGLREKMDEIEQVDGATDRLSLSSRVSNRFDGASEDLAVKPPMGAGQTHRLSDTPPRETPVKRTRSKKSIAPTAMKPMHPNEQIEPALLSPGVKAAIKFMRQQDIENVAQEMPPAPVQVEADDADLAPLRPQNLGQQAAAGGTYLSYR